MNNLHVNWYMNAVGGLINAIGKRTLKQSSHESQLRYNFCLRTAGDLTERATCALNAFQERGKRGDKRQFHPIKKSGRAPRRRRSSDNNSLRKPTTLYYFNSVVNQSRTPPTTTPYPSPMEALSQLVVHAIRGDNNVHEPSQHSPTISKLRQLHSLVKSGGRKPSRRVEILSPRLAPLLPQTTVQSKRIYSPSFLSFYRDSAMDNVVSLPDVLDDAGMTSKDQVCKTERASCQLMTAICVYKTADITTVVCTIAKSGPISERVMSVGKFVSHAQLTNQRICHSCNCD